MVYRRVEGMQPHSCHAQRHRVRIYTSFSFFTSLSKSREEALVNMDKGELLAQAINSWYRHTGVFINTPHKFRATSTKV
jgi:hypothetical protein